MSHWYLNRSTRERMSWGDNWLDRRLTIFYKWLKSTNWQVQSHMYVIRQIKKRKKKRIKPEILRHIFVKL